jgi:hypothetical protein
MKEHIGIVYPGILPNIALKVDENNSYLELM